MTRKNHYIPAALFLALSAGEMLSGCIENDIPYPRIPQMILSIAAEGESREANIDSIAFGVTVYLDEDTDIENVSFSDFTFTEGAEADPNLLEGTYDLSKPLIVSLTRYQTYDWEIRAVQDIERIFRVKGEIGQSVIDPVAKRVVVTMPTGTDLSKLTLTEVKLGPVGITTLTPNLVPGPLDLSYPMRVAVMCHGRTEYWTIYAETTDLLVTTSADAWSQVVWVYGEGPADGTPGVRYRDSESSEWTEVPASEILGTPSNFSCCIHGLAPLSQYTVQAYSGEDMGNEVEVTTEATADIPDGDFEQWSKTDKGMWNPWNEGGLQYWDTGNQGSFTVRVNLTEPSEHTATGSGLSAQLSTKFVAVFGIGKLGSGSIYTGKFAKLDGMNGVLNFGQPWTLRPTKLKGFYQYQGGSIDYATEEYNSLKGLPDTCHIYVALTDWTAPYEIRTNPSNRQLFDKNAPYIIGYGELLKAGTMDSFEAFEIPIEYKSTSAVPSYLQITCTSSKYGDFFTGSTGSILWVDQFSFGWD